MVITFSSDLELKCTERMGDVLETIDDAMSVIVCWVDAPFVPRVRMANESDSVSDEISHVWISVLHIHFNSKAAFSFFHSSLSHHFEKLKVFIDTSFSVWGVFHGISVLFHFLRFLMANVGFVFFDKTDSHVVELLEVIR